LPVQSRDVMQESPAPRHFSVNHSMSMTLDEAEKNLLLQTLTETRNNVSEAARKLGITRMTMRYRMAKHQIEV
jgi:DNA-binding NtrC family response regulator